MKEIFIVMRGNYGEDGTVESVIGPAKAFLNADKACDFAEKLEKSKEDDEMAFWVDSIEFDEVEE